MAGAVAVVDLGGAGVWDCGECGGVGDVVDVASVEDDVKTLGMAWEARLA